MHTRPLSYIKIHNHLGTSETEIMRIARVSPNQNKVNVSGSRFGSTVVPLLFSFFFSLQLPIQSVVVFYMQWDKGYHQASEFHGVVLEITVQEMPNIFFP